MSTLVPAERHPALDLDEATRTEYATVVASIAYADLDTSADEVAQLQALCDALEVTAGDRQRVVDAAASPDAVDVDAALDRLDDRLRHALLVDAVDVAYADRTLEPSELGAIERIADRLGVPRAQLSMIERYVARQRVGDRPTSAAGLVSAVAAVAIALGAFVLTDSLTTWQLSVSGAVAVTAGIAAYVGVDLLFRS